MLDRSTSNLFQADSPATSPADPPAALFEGDGPVSGPAMPPPPRAAPRRRPFTLPRVAASRAKARSAGRQLRRFSTALLIVLAVFRLAAGGCGAEHILQATRTESSPARSAARPTRPAPSGHRSTKRHATSRRRRQPRRAATSARPAARPAAISHTVVTSVVAAAPPYTSAVRQVASTRGGAQEFGFEH
jgi:hypothetical protein